MKAKIMLADLVLLQMEGYLNKAMQELAVKNQIINVITEAKEKSSNPDLYKSIVNKSIVNQFGDSHITLRELGQNAKDSYPIEETVKTVDFNIEETPDEYQINVRDYGKGMNPQSLIRDLLIPYNSSKFMDTDKIGEHGIGWYSIMDLSYKVEVITGKENKLSKATVYKEGDNWFTDIEVNPGDQKGTLVVAHVVKSKTNPDLIKKNIEKHLGLVPSTAVDIKVNGEKINNLDKQYPYAAAIVINYKSRKDRLKIGYRKNVDKKFRTMKLTQDGLYIGDIENPFVKKSMHYDILNTLLEAGINIWVDLPKNIGLTKGRKEVVKKDRNIYYSALTRVFESIFANKILDDNELVTKMDNDLAYIFKNVFFDSYDLNSSEYFRNGKPFDFDTMAAGEPESHVDPLTGFNTTAKPDEEQYLKRSKRYFNEITHFIYEIFSKQFISAQKVLSSRHSMVKVSPNDLIKVDNRGLLYEGNLEEMPAKDGVFVDKDSKLAYAILNQIKVVKMTEKEKDMPGTLVSTESADVQIKKMPFSFIKEKFTKINKAKEYLKFFEAIKYLDALTQKAAKHRESEIFFLYNPREDKICPDESGIGFNFHSQSLQDIVQSIALNKADKDVIYKILDLYLYAKTYMVSGKFYITVEEIEEFYEKTKKGIRDAFVEYVFNNRVPLEQDLTNILVPDTPGQGTTINELIDILV